MITKPNVSMTIVDDDGKIFKQSAEYHGSDGDEEFVYMNGDRGENIIKFLVIFSNLMYLQ